MDNPTRFSGWEAAFNGYSELVHQASPRKRRRRWVPMPRHRWGHPLLSGLGLLGLVLSGSLISAVPMASSEVLSRTLGIVQDPDGRWVVNDFDENSTDLLEIHEGWTYVHLRREVVRTGGFLAPTTERTATRVVCSPQPNPAVQPVLADWFERRGEKEAANIARNSPIETSRVLWEGWVLNGLLVGSCVLSLVSLANFSSWRRSRRGRRAFAKTRCPGCGYSLEGIRAVDGVSTCPECGDESLLPEPSARPNE